MSGAAGNAQDVDIDIGALFAAVWQRRKLIALVSLGVAIAAFLIATIMTAKYQAETRILIETRESVYSRPSVGTGADGGQPDQESVSSQVELITSNALLSQVAKTLKLGERDEFSSEPGFAIPFISAFGSSSTLEDRVLRNMLDRLKVYRVEGSRVIVVRFNSRDPRLAAAVPNAIADAYISFLRKAKTDSESSATDWLGPEIANLSASLKETEKKIADFRAANDIPIGQNNAALATQQLSELSTELSRVRASKAAAEARARSIRQALDSGGSVDAIPEVQASNLIQRLVERKVQMQSDIADLSTTLLDNHPRIRALRSQLNQLDGQMRSEARKILAGLKTEAATARIREQQLIAEVNRLKAEAARVGDKEVELRAMERDATSQRQLLESYLTRNREAKSRREANYVPVNARVFERALVPGEPYFPKKLPIAGATFAGTLLLMIVQTLLAELFSGRAMRASGLIESGAVDEVAMPVRRERADRVEEEPELNPGLTVDQVAVHLIDSGASRAIFVSPEGDEAAATSIMTARALADSGLRVVLLDMTASSAASRPMLETATMPGITDLLAARASFRDVIHGDHFSDCHVIPSGVADPAVAMRAIDRLPIVMDALSRVYDIIIIEGGPTDSAGIDRLVDDSTEVLLSILSPQDMAVQNAAADLVENGYDDLVLATPAGSVAPYSPEPGRSAA